MPTIRTLFLSPRPFARAKFSHYFRNAAESLPLPPLFSCFYSPRLLCLSTASSSYFSRKEHLPSPTSHTQKNSNNAGKTRRCAKRGEFARCMTKTNVLQQQPDSVKPAQQSKRCQRRESRTSLHSGAFIQFQAIAACHHCHGRELSRQSFLLPPASR